MQTIPSDVVNSFRTSDQYFPTPLQMFQFYDKYSRFNYDLGRRETWIETVDRSVEYLKELSHNKLAPDIYTRISDSILNMRAMPSMRLLAMAGKAARRQGLSIYNCSYMPVDDISSFVEALIISMSGCGVGFSVEWKYVSQLPRIQRPRNVRPTDYIIEDTTEGWADALRFGLETWFDGGDVKFNYDMIRPYGSPLRVKGGRASGAEPLRKMLDFARERIRSSEVYLRPIDAHDIMCSVGNAAVMGGTRRTAMISLFDYFDSDMLNAKTGDFETHNSQRWNANNSAVIPSNITREEFDDIFGAMFESGRGEPGLFSRDVANRMKPARRAEADFGTNPCGEILLRPYQLCNLSIAVARAEDTFDTLADKVRVASIIGTIQSMETNFPGLRSVWKDNAEVERLLGVDITGQMDSPVSRDPEVQSRLRQIAVDTNREFAECLGINQSASVTCVKPSGNSSQLLNCSSGIHARWSRYYIRNVRVGAKTPVYQVLKDAGVPMSPENGQDRETATTWVVSFPIASSPHAIVREERTAIEQCEYWLQVKQNWTEHNPSVTISYKPEEKKALLNWVWEHLEFVNGMSFLPYSDAQYSQMPYIAIDSDNYELLSSTFPDIDFSRIYLYESEDLTTVSGELACVSGLCEV